MPRSTRLTPVVQGDIGAALFDVAAEFASRVLDLAEEIAAIPAPTGAESARSRFVFDRMTALPFDTVELDDSSNVVGLVRGFIDRPRLLVAAHLDTVFPMETELHVGHDRKRSWGPGIGDNSLGVAAAMLVPSMLAQAGIRPDVDLLITGNVGEEGLGNLKGMIEVMDRHDEIGAVVAVEGHNLGRVTHIAVGSLRYRVRIEGQGGHSWGDFGRKNAIHAAARIIAALDEIELPANPKTTLSVGVIEGGTSVNTIAPTCTFLLDLRSVDAQALAELDASVRKVVGDESSDIRVTADLIGVRPAGQVTPGARITAIASAILESMGITPTGDASSTDANIPISRGIPAVCIGLTHGGNVHKESEYIERDPVRLGLYQLLGLIVAVAEELRHGRIP